MGVIVLVNGEKILKNKGRNIASIRALWNSSGKTLLNYAGQAIAVNPIGKYISWYELIAK